jgi:hypothetical protein
MLISMVRMSLMKAGSRGGAALAASAAAWLAAASSRQTARVGEREQAPEDQGDPEQGHGDEGHRPGDALVVDQHGRHRRQHDDGHQQGPGPVLA